MSDISVSFIPNSVTVNLSTEPKFIIKSQSSQDSEVEDEEGDTSTQTLQVDSSSIIVDIRSPGASNASVGLYVRNTGQSEIIKIGSVPLLDGKADLSSVSGIILPSGSSLYANSSIDNLSTYICLGIIPPGTTVNMSPSSSSSSNGEVTLKVVLEHKVSGTLRIEGLSTSSDSTSASDPK